MLSEEQSKCGVRGRTGLYEPVSTKNENENPKEARPLGHRRGGEMA